MQTLFALNCDKELTFENAKKTYWKSIERSYHLLLFNLFVLTEITQVALEDGKKRKSKHLPSDIDKIFTPKLFNNELIQSLANSISLNKEYDRLGFTNSVDTDLFKKMYKAFSKKEEYGNYLKDENGSHIDILLELYRFCRSNEIFTEIMEDGFVNWSDDKSLVIGALKKCLKSLPSEDKDFYKSHYPDAETVKEYGEALLINTNNDDESLLELIKPLLKNWDHDRLAVIDMILIKMAIIEMLSFETIPTKVTLNEYVEVSKMYSTPKSKDFINGILDKILKDLTEDGKIVKKGRGLVE
ncbi:MAG: transcription antitermination factor NusB [Saprospiraceae bacterium]|nr:transcription antitermination factor NusB [Saprospiraceae bacterium]